MGVNSWKNILEKKMELNYLITYQNVADYKRLMSEYIPSCHYYYLKIITLHDSAMQHCLI